MRKPANINQSNISIKPRRIAFNIPDDLPRYWNGGCPVRTHLFNAMSISAPGFERLVISSALLYKNQVKNPILKQQLKGFIGQEAAHGNGFTHQNNALVLQGYNVKYLEQDNVKRFKNFTPYLHPRLQLALTVGAEHWAAIISDLLLKDRRAFEGADPSIDQLWIYHSIEEIEHKGVAFDLYNELGGGYFTRCGGMIIVTIMLVILLLRNFFHLLLCDRLIFKPWIWWRCFTVSWWQPGLVRKLIIPYLRFYWPGFHPWQEDNSALILRFKENIQ